MNFHTKTLICASIAMLCYFTANSQGNWEKETKRAMDKIDEKTLKHDISFLSDSLCNGRGTGTRGNVEAAFWIKRKFKNAGLLSFGESYGSHFITQTGAVAHNIIGMLPGSYTMPRDRYLIIGAHFDHLGQINGQTYPGADANASGTAVLTSLAEMFAQMKRQGKVYDSSIIFVAFDAKEMDMAGSESLWKLIGYGLLKDPVSGLQITKDKITAMINIDQIGSSLSPVRWDRKDYLLMLGNHSLPKDKRSNLEACNMLYDINLDLCLSYYGSRNFTDVFYRLSDQRAFVDNKIPAVFFTSGITMNTNKTRDVVENLDMEVLHKRLDLIYHWVETLL